MKLNNICSKCGETSESDWDTCWNCQEKMIPIVSENTESNKNNNICSEDNLVMVDGRNIVSAGKQIKLSVILFVLILIMGLIVFIIESITNKGHFYFWGGIVGFVILIAILINVFQAGKDLMKSVPLKKE